MFRKLAFLLLALMAVPASAQVSELGLTGGMTYYLGDLNPTKHFAPGSHFGFGALYRYNFDSRYAIRIQGLYSKLEASDANSNDPLQVERNLDFRANLLEASFLLEINFFDFRGTGKEKKNWTPYVFGGLAYFRANPKAQLDDTMYELQPLGTEGQGTSAGGDPYKVDLLSIPFGVGFKFAFSSRMDVGIEWGMRSTSTDYIDDVSGVYYDNALLAYENGPQAALLADRSLVEDKSLNTDRARGDSNTRDWYNYTGVFDEMRLGPKFYECDYYFNGKRR